MVKAMNFNQARDGLNTHNMRITRTDGEFRVTPHEYSGKAAEDIAYYTDDIEDAYFTGVDMRKRINARFAAACAAIAS